ncbi:MAG: TraR/DksA C4-type zinc finger protein [Balneolaceae bacterium]|nr:TraR/DksA C4-type zinc finger protein [Balneolaceae bacterium]
MEQDKFIENPEELETPYSEEELDHFKNLLLDKRKEASDQLGDLKASLEDITDAEDADRSSTTHHMSDVGSEVEDEEVKYALIERTRRYIDQIDRALERIEKGTYGVCMATGKKIAKERLEAVPHTRYSIDAKKKGLDEKGNIPKDIKL